LTNIISDGQHGSTADFIVESLQFGLPDRLY